MQATTTNTEVSAVKATRPFTILVDENVSYRLHIMADSLKEAKKIAKQIKDGEQMVADFVGGDAPSSYGVIKAKVWSLSV
jgi:hypothetical protein